MAKKFEFLKLDDGKQLRNLIISYCLCVLLILLGSLLPGSAEEKGYNAIKDKFVSIFKPQETPVGGGDIGGSTGGGDGGQTEQNQLTIKSEGQKVKTKSSLKLRAYYSGEDVTNKVIWKVDDTTLAYVNDEGKLWGRKVGEVSVTATLKTDQTVTISQEYKVVYNFRILFRMLIGHVGIFFVLGILGTVVFLKLFPQNLFLAAVISQVIGIAVAVTSELFQLPAVTYGRAASFDDALINVASHTIAIGIVISTYYSLRWRKNQLPKQNT